MFHSFLFFVFVDGFFFLINTKKRRIDSRPQLELDCNSFCVQKAVQGGRSHGKAKQRICRSGHQNSSSLEGHQVEAIGGNVRRICHFWRCFDQLYQGRRRGGFLATVQLREKRIFCFWRLFSFFFFIQATFITTVSSIPPLKVA